mmetsp:Transcript_4952/g.9856  ORF Transcript_4952/g.9856 Transcript_4952/m.9856 type:complete len:208 (-) Transcript_4952:99-722(-)
MMILPRLSALPLFFLVFLCGVFGRLIVVVDAHKNVHGQDLQSCSSEGMALTGYTRSGYCVNREDDVGSHHICINLQSTTNATSTNTRRNENFCQVTGQPNWCAGTDMPCHIDDDDDDDDKNETASRTTASFRTCPIQNWCVCQWAFAAYIEKAGGCSAIQEIVCDAIHEQALLSYQLHQRGNPSYQRALECLVDRCGLNDSVLSSRG